MFAVSFQSPAKATYNVRSWQDDFDEEERVTMMMQRNVHIAFVCFAF